MVVSLSPASLLRLSSDQPLPLQVTQISLRVLLSLQVGDRLWLSTRAVMVFLLRLAQATRHARVATLVLVLEELQAMKNRFLLPFLPNFLKVL